MSAPFGTLVPGQTGTADLAAKSARRDAARMTAEMFPDATPEQSVEIAIEFEKRLLMDAGPVDPKVSPQERDRQRNESNEVLGSSLVASGGAAGFALGNIPGAIVGAGLGGLAQSGIRRAEGKDVSVGDALRNARNQATFEVAGIGAVDKTVGAIARVMRGDKAIAQELAGAMRRAGVQPALQDISTTQLVREGRTVLGSFPLLSKPFRRRQADVAQAFDSSLSRYIESVSPDVSMIRKIANEQGPEAASAFQEALSEGALESIEKGFSAIRRERDGLYAELSRVQAEVEKQAAKEGRSLAVPSTESQAALGKAATRVANDTAYTADGAIGEVGQYGDVVEFINDIADRRLRGKMTFNELRSLKKRISRQINASKDDPDAVEILVGLKDGVEKDLLSAASVDPRMLAAYRNATSYSEQYLTLLQQASVKRVNRFVRGSGRQSIQTVTTEFGDQIRKNAGTSDVSSLVDELSKTKSPAEIRQFFDVLRKGVGEKEASNVIRRSLGKKVDDAVRAAFKESAEVAGDPSYKPGVLLRKLNLDDPNDPRYNATIAMFKASGLDTGEVLNLSRTLDAIFSVKNPNISQFVQRRGILGGARSIITGVTGGMIGAGAASGPASAGLVPAAAFLILGRSYGKWMTDPRRARLVMRAADLQAPEQARARAIVSLLTDRELWSSSDREESQTSEMVRSEALRQLSSANARRRFIENLDREMGWSTGMDGGVR